MLWRRCHIIVSDNRLNLDAFHRRKLFRHFDVHVVARIVSVKASDTRTPVSRLKCVEKDLRRRRGKDFADGYRVAHVLSDIADECRFVTGTAARNHADFALDGCLDIFQHARILVDGCDQLLVTFHKPLKHVLNNSIRIIDNSLHSWGVWNSTIYYEIAYLSPSFAQPSAPNGHS